MLDEVILKKLESVSVGFGDRLLVTKADSKDGTRAHQGT